MQILSFIGTYSLNLLVITFYTLPIIILFKIRNFKKFTILLSAFLILLLISYYGFNKIEQIEKKSKKKISPSIKLVSPKFNIERFFIDEPIENKINELFRKWLSIDKDLIINFSRRYY